MKKLVLLLLLFTQVKAQYTKDDTLRGDYNANRNWWDLQHYDLNIKVNPKEQTISGYNIITYKVLGKSDILQIDLQSPLEILGIEQDGQSLKYNKVGNNAYLVKIAKETPLNTIAKLKINYQGKPRVAVHAPWDGGLSWAKDKAGDLFLATSCQGLGSSVWWPCKDHMADEPDSMRITVTVPDGLFDVSNGRLEKSCLDAQNNRTNTWVVKNPINNYSVNMNVANYVHFAENYIGEKGPLSLNYYVLPENLEKAKEQFKEVPRMLKAFEHWFGPYPFYEDGYKLVEVPYLGMEHQSSVTYGNGYKNGYLGRDLSGTGWGLKWDFIIVHESGHEWFANNITYKDAADMWIHEGFTDYSETLFVEYYFGKDAANEYNVGLRKNIQNDIPIIGKYNLNSEGSRDMYFKGGNMIHTIRQIIGDDEKFRKILRGLNSEFYHQTVTTDQIEKFISRTSGINFDLFFDQYLRTTKIPKLVIQQSNKKFEYSLTNIVDGLSMPIKVTVDGKSLILNASARKNNQKGRFEATDKNYYITTEILKN